MKTYQAQRTVLKMSSNDGNNNVTDSVIEMLQTVESLIDNNKDLIDNVVGDAGVGGSIDMGQYEPLVERSVSEEKVVLVAEVGTLENKEISVGINGSKVVMTANGDSIEADNIPKDVDLSELEAGYKNGVLTVEIPRDNGGNTDAENKEDDE